MSTCNMYTSNQTEWDATRICHGSYAVLQSDGRLKLHFDENSRTLSPTASIDAGRHGSDIVQSNQCLNCGEHRYRNVGVSMKLIKQIIT